MGMFDEVVCEMPLPGTVPAWIEPGHKFQTKDTPSQHLYTYTIASDGAFSGEDANNYTGTIEFYTSNICGCGPGVYTRNGEDAESVSFVAKIVDGRVSELKQTEYEIKAALPSSEQASPINRPTPEQVAGRKRRNAESLVGRTLYVLWGCEKKGYRVEVIAENDCELSTRVLEDHGRVNAGKFEILDRRDRDRIFFDSEEEALAHKNSRHDDWNARLNAYNEYAKAWSDKRSSAGSPDGT